MQPESHGRTYKTSDRQTDRRKPEGSQTGRHTDIYTNRLANVAKQTLPGRQTAKQKETISQAKQQQPASQPDK